MSLGFFSEALILVVASAKWPNFTFSERPFREVPPKKILAFSAQGQRLGWPLKKTQIRGRFLKNATRSGRETLVPAFPDLPVDGAPGPKLGVVPPRALPDADLFGSTCGSAV